MKRLTDNLPILDFGEPLILAECILLPTRIKLDEPNLKPQSNTIDFCNESETSESRINKAMRNLRAQSIIDD